MKKFKKFQLIFLLLMILIPITVHAGIICSDGWESSCSVPGPGCCSHHGGIPGGGSNYSSSSSSDGFWGLLLLGGMGLIIINIYMKIRGYFDPDYNKTYEELKSEREIKERYEKEGTLFKTYDEYVETFINNEYEDIGIMINDSYFKKLQANILYRILKNNYDSDYGWTNIVDQIYNLRKDNYSEKIYLKEAVNSRASGNISRLFYNLIYMLAYAENKYDEIIKYIINKNYLNYNNDNELLGELIIFMIISKDYIKNNDLVEYVINSILENNDKIIINKSTKIYNILYTREIKYFNLLINSDKVEFKINFKNIKEIMDDTESLELFFKYFSYINHSKSDLNDSILYITKKSDLKVLKVFLNNSKNVISDELIIDILHYSIKYNKMDIFNWLFDDKDRIELDSIYKDGHTLLLLAIRKNNIELVKTLVKCGANIDASAENGITPIEYSFLQNRLTICRFLLKQNYTTNKNIEEIKENLKKGFGPSYTYLSSSDLSKDLITREKDFYKNNV